MTYARTRLSLGHGERGPRPNELATNSALDHIEYFTVAPVGPTDDD
jgi:hypothetical protein